jgi:hypothetical protein
MECNKCTVRRRRKEMMCSGRKSGQRALSMIRRSDAVRRTAAPPHHNTATTTGNVQPGTLVQRVMRHECAAHLDKKQLERQHTWCH